jgi:hypothetical protein
MDRLTTNNRGNASVLIVDFPSSIITEQRVRFAAVTHGMYIPYPSEEENGKKWYSKANESRSRIQVARDAASCAQLLVDAARNDPEDIQLQQVLVHCVGFEGLLSRNVLRQYQTVREAKRNHVRVVLQEQRRQRIDGDVSSRGLARVSKTSSEQARQRAHRVALVNAAIL